MSHTDAESWAARLKPMSQTGPLAHEKFAWVGYGGRGPIWDLDHLPHPNHVHTRWSKRPSEKDATTPDDGTSGMLVPILTAAAIFAVGYYALVSL